MIFCINYRASVLMLDSLFLMISFKCVWIIYCW